MADDPAAADPVAPVTTTLEFSNPRFKPKRESQDPPVAAAPAADVLVEDVFASISAHPIVSSSLDGEGELGGDTDEGEVPGTGDVAEAEPVPSPADVVPQAQDSPQIDGGEPPSDNPDETTGAAAGGPEAPVPAAASRVNALAGIRKRPLAPVQAPAASQVKEQARSQGLRSSNRGNSRRMKLR